MPLPNDLPEPPADSFTKAAVGTGNPYSAGKFRKRKLPGSSSDVMMVVMKPPSFRERLVNIVWTVVTTIAVLATYKYFEKIMEASSSLLEFLRIILLG